MDPRSALTPTYGSLHPQGSGWVAYHDVGPAMGPSGLAMTWRLPDDGIIWLAAVDRVNEGLVTGSGRIREGESLNEAMGNMLGGRRITHLLNETKVLSLMFPHVANNWVLCTMRGLPHLSDHAEAARRAIDEAELVPAQRAAFRACLDNGMPWDVSLAALRKRTHASEWPALEVAARHHELAGVVLKTSPFMMAGADPMETLRRRWPGMTDAHLRRLGEGRHTPYAVPIKHSHQFSLLNLLFASPVDWWPKRGEWPAFQVCAFTLGTIAHCCRTGVPYAPLLAACKGDWPAFAARMARAAGMSDTDIKAHVMADRGNDCGDPVRSLYRDLMVPLVASRKDDEDLDRIERAYARDPLGKDDIGEPALQAAASAARALLYEGKSAPGILETSRAWHGAQAVMQAEIRRAAGEMGWPPLFEGEFRVGDIGIVALKDYEGLREEGAFGQGRDGVAGLDHCVVSRLPECLSGRAHILSVRRHAPDGTWSRLSTCQVSIRESDGRITRVSIEEHRGLKNATPDADAVEAVSHLSQELLFGLVLADPHALAGRGDPKGGSIALKCGYDWREPEELARALLTWEPFLPRWARGLGPDGLYDALVEREMLPRTDPAPPAGPAMR